MAELFDTGRITAGKTTGRSSRTPYKHFLLNALLGKIVGVLSLRKPSVPAKAHPCFHCVDLCGGDGLSNESHECSPAIFLRHLRYANTRHGLPTHLDVIEKDENTFTELCQNTVLSDRENVELILGDARKYSLPELWRLQAAFVHCDPNTVHQMPVTRDLVGSFSEATTYLVTLGCNVGGMKMLPRESRQQWFEYVDDLCGVLPRHHDALLFRLVRDDSQWAYLASLPAVWSERFAELGTKAGDRFWKKGVGVASYRNSRVSFNSQLNRLFLTKSEVQ